MERSWILPDELKKKIDDTEAELLDMPLSIFKAKEWLWWQEMRKQALSWPLKEDDIAQYVELITTLRDALKERQTLVVTLDPNAIKAPTPESFRRPGDLGSIG